MPPPLHTVQLALPAPLRAISHVEQLVSDFLLPSTIDAAVYLELNGVLSRYSDLFKVTVGAMDGAATRGKLALCEQLYTSRTEGCSPAAFTGAAANGHLEGLQWLFRHYPEFEKTMEQFVAAAGNGHIRVVEFLTPAFHYQNRDFGAALEAAAANGHMKVVKSLMPYVTGGDKALVTAAANGQVEVVQFIKDEYELQCMAGRWPDALIGTTVDRAFEAAVQNDHKKVMEILAGICRPCPKADALWGASQKGNSKMVARMLDVGEFDMSAIACALERASRYDSCALVEYFLGQFSRFDVSPMDCSSKLREEKRLVAAFLQLLSDSVNCGRMDLVKILLDWSEHAVHDTFHQAALSKKWEVAKMVLRSYVSKGQLSHLNAKTIVSSALTAEYAAARGDVEMAELLVTRVDAFEAHSALKVAVESDHLEIVKLFIDHCDSSSKLDALVCAALCERVEMVEYLLDYCDQDTVSQAVTGVASPDNLEVSKLLLKRCNPGTYISTFEDAAEIGLLRIVQLLLDDITVDVVNRRIISAAAQGWWICWWRSPMRRLPRTPWKLLRC